MQLEEEDGWENVGPDGESLAELDERGPEAGEGLAKSDGVLPLKAFVVQDLAPEQKKSRVKTCHDLLPKVFLQYCSYKYWMGSFN